jgi:hypothetical protein
MIRYSHVALLIPLFEPLGREVSEFLCVTPTTIRESKGYRRGSTDELEPWTDYTWMLDSKKDVTSQPVVRLHALLDQIEEFSDRLRLLDPKYKPWIDILFHITPQHPHGIRGEFDWITLPPEMMGRMSRLQLMLSYEVMWFDHPDWRLPWYKRFLRKLRK